MRPIRFAAALLALLLGFVGVVACIAGIYAVWTLSPRFEQANEKVFARIEKALASAQDRVRGVQKRIQNSKISSSDIAGIILAGAMRNAQERVGILAEQLQTADSWLETSTESVRNVQQILELGELVGIHLNTTSIDAVIEKLTSLRTTLQESRLAEGFRDAAEKEGDSEETRRSRITKLLGRTLVTMSDMDSRLDESVNRLSELQADTQELKTRTSKYILWTTIGSYVILAWIGAGQIALCRWGWKKCFRPA